MDLHRLLQRELKRDWLSLHGQAVRNARTASEQSARRTAERLEVERALHAASAPAELRTAL